MKTPPPRKIDVQAHLTGPDPTRRGVWTWIHLDLADGSKLEIRVPHVVGVQAACMSDPLGDSPSVTRTTRDGRVRRGRLGALFS